MSDAANFIQIIETRQGIQISCPEEIAYLNHWITKEEVEALAKPLLKSNYGQYLVKIIK
jgi:glucose-1-phosphate thymidylyltransferase